MHVCPRGFQLPLEHQKGQGPPVCLFLPFYSICHSLPPSSFPSFPFLQVKNGKIPLSDVPWLLKKALTLVVGGDSPSAVMDFSSILSSLVSSTAGFSITSCFFSGLAVLAGQREKNPEMDVYWNDSGQCRQELLCGLLRAAWSALGLHVLSLPKGTSHVQLQCKYHRAGAPLALSGTHLTSSSHLVAPLLNQRILGLT